MREQSKVTEPYSQGTDAHMAQPKRMHYWALLANPRTYRIEDAVSRLKIDKWVTKGRALAAGDRVIICTQ